MTTRTATVAALCAAVGLVVGSAATQCSPRHPADARVRDAALILDAAHAFERATDAVFLPPAPGHAPDAAALTLQQRGEHVHRLGADIASALHDYLTTDTDTTARAKRALAPARVHGLLERLRHELDDGLVDQGPATVLTARSRLNVAMARVELDVP